MRTLVNTVRHIPRLAYSPCKLEHIILGREVCKTCWHRPTDRPVLDAAYWIIKRRGKRRKIAPSCNSYWKHFMHYTALLHCKLFNSLQFKLLLLCTVVIVHCCHCALLSLCTVVVVHCCHCALLLLCTVVPVSYTHLTLPTILLV